jgi:monoamine oxidase
MDLGCEWLHSADRNVLARLAEQLGFSLHCHQSDWTTRLSQSGETQEVQVNWIAAREAYYQEIQRAARGPSDPPAAAVLPSSGCWNLLLDAVSTWANAVELERLSVKDNARYEDTGINWRLCGGYGRMIADLAESLPIAYGADVSRVAHGGQRIRIETSRGVLHAARVIITVPTEMLAHEHLAFDPPLPEKLDAAAGLPLGVADKLFLRLDGIPTGTEEELFLIGSTRCRETMSYQVRPMGRPRIHCFFGGDFAIRLEHDGIQAMVAFATDELAEHFGNNIRQRVSPLTASAWRADPFARGSYSYAKPGHADDRARLAEPVDGRLFFAGEACSPNFFTTAHGAFETGTMAADAALASLRIRSSRLA